MNIALTVPSMSIPHGGIRVIIEWANRLSEKHQVTLFCRQGQIPPTWMRIKAAVTLTSSTRDLKDCAMLVVCSPHDIDLLEAEGMPRKKLIFLQMLEH